MQLHKESLGNVLGLPGFRPSFCNCTSCVCYYDDRKSVCKISVLKETTTSSPPPPPPKKVNDNPFLKVGSLSYGQLMQNFAFCSP